MALTLGRAYAAIELEVPLGRSARVRVLEDAGQPSVWPLDAFEIVSGRLPSNWHLSVTEAGDMVLGPASFLAQGFWSRYFDGDPSAQIEYERELKESNER